MFTSRLTILTCKRVLSLSTLYIKVCFFYSKPKEKKKKTQESVERVMDGNSMRLVIVMIMMMGFVMLALGVSQANETTQSSLPPHFPPSPLPTHPSLPPSSEDSLVTTIIGDLPKLSKVLEETIHLGKSKIPGAAKGVAKCLSCEGCLEQYGPKMKTACSFARNILLCGLFKF